MGLHDHGRVVVRYWVRCRGTRLDRVRMGTRVRLQAWSMHVLDTDPCLDTALQDLPCLRSSVLRREDLSSWYLP